MPLTVPVDDRRFGLAACLAIIAFGVGLRTIQYAARGSMWLDELAIAINIRDRSLAGLLLRPLDMDQVAPPGFLALEKLGAVLLGYGESGLRLFPWLASLAALVLFWRVAARYASGVALAGGLLAFAASPALVWYAGNAKQYSGDVMVTLLLLLLALRFEEEGWSTRRAALWGLAGGAAILVSQPGVLVAAGLACGILARRIPARRPIAPALALAAGWGLGAVAVTAASLLVVGETRGPMAETWGNSFMRAPWAGPTAPMWVPFRLLRLLSYVVIFVLPKSFPEILFVAAFGVLCLSGAWALGRQRPSRAVLLAVPVVVGVLAALFRLLPLYNRLSLYMAPCLLIAAMAGAEDLRARLAGRARALASLALLALFAMPAGAVVGIAPPPYRAEETRPVLEQLRARARPGDIIYAYHAAGLALRFYAPDLEWVQGTAHREDPRRYLREVDRFRGRPRVWLFYTHGYPCEPEAIRSYLAAIGAEREGIVDPFGLRGQRAAAAYLYDLADPRKLARSDAATHPIEAATGERWWTRGCGYNREAGAVSSDRRLDDRGSTDPVQVGELALQVGVALTLDPPLVGPASARRAFPVSGVKGVDDAHTLDDLPDRREAHAVEP